MKSPATLARQSNRHRSHPSLRLVAGLVAVMLSVAACGTGDPTGDGDGTSSPGGDPPTEGVESAGTLTIGVNLDVPSWDPLENGSGGTNVIMWQTVYDTLLRVDNDGTVVPNAAESFTFNDDRTVLTLRLREGIRFHDGSPIDVDAVVASLERSRDGGGVDSGRLAGLEFEAGDDGETVVVRSSAPLGVLPKYLALTPGIIANPAHFDRDDLATRPAGSGPYILDVESTTSGSTYVFTRNEDHWEREAYPYDSIVLRVMEDETARLSALRTGQIDAAFVTSGAVAEAQSAGLNLVQNEVNWAGLHIVDRDGQRTEALGDVRVRQAINMVFDREAIVELMFGGLGVPTNQVFNPNSPAFVEELLDRYPYDIEAARQLMADAGYEDGFDVTLPEFGFLADINPHIVQQLSEINIRATRETVPPQQAVQSVLIEANFPLFFFTLESQDPLWDVIGLLEPSALWNVRNTEHPDLTPLIDEAKRTADQSADVFRQINELMVEEAWFVPWAFITDTWALAPDVMAEPVYGSQAPYLRTFRPASGS